MIIPPGSDLESMSLGAVRKLLEEIAVEKQLPVTAIVAFNLEDDEHIKKLSGRYGPDRVVPLHMTLLYLGDVADNDRDDVLERLKTFSKVYASVEGVYNGWASFDDTGDGYPHVLLYDSPQLPFFWQRLVEVMEGIRPEQNHGFTPHTTLSYLKYRDKPTGDINYSKTFKSVWLFWGDNKYEFPLVGDVVEKQLPIADESMTALVKVKLKGGPGSGHRGHAGRPGSVGGSVPTDFADLLHTRQQQAVEAQLLTSYGELSLSEVGKSNTSWITPDGKYAGARGGHTESARALMSNFGVKGSAHDFMRGYGFVRVQKFENQFGVEFDSMQLTRRAVSALNDLLIISPGVETSYYDGATDSTGYDLEKYLRRVRLKEGVEEKQLPIADESMTALVKARINIFYDESDALAVKMYTGSVSLGQWQESMKQLIRECHTSCAAIGGGGWDEMTWAQWGRLGTPLREQYRYLQGFSEFISENREDISLRAIQARARLYGEGAGGSTVLTQAGPVLEGLLPFLPRDGSTRCLMRCHCHWGLEVIGKQSDGSQEVRAVWTLSPRADHCDDCMARDGHVEIMVVPAGEVVPDRIGGI